MTAISTGRCNTLTKTHEDGVYVDESKVSRRFHGDREGGVVEPLGKQAGALKSIGRAFGEPSSSVYHQLAPHEGIETPAERINASVALTG